MPFAFKHRSYVERLLDGGREPKSPNAAPRTNWQDAAKTDIGAREDGPELPFTSGPENGSCDL